MCVHVRVCVMCDVCVCVMMEQLLYLYIFLEWYHNINNVMCIYSKMTIIKSNVLCTFIDIILHTRLMSLRVGFPPVAISI